MEPKVRCRRWKSCECKKCNARKPHVKVEACRVFFCFYVGADMWCVRVPKKSKKKAKRKARGLAARRG
jgi:hypothetical protein